MILIIISLLSNTFLGVANGKKEINTNADGFFSASVPSYLKVGDILFCDIKPEIANKLEKIGITDIERQWYYSDDHCAMYIGNNRFIEAAPYHYSLLKKDWIGVVVSPFWKIRLWGENFTYCSVLTTQDMRNKAVEWARKQLRSPYQFTINYPNQDPNDASDELSDHWYCAELIWAAYWNQGIKIILDWIWDKPINATTTHALKWADNVIEYGNKQPSLNIGEGYEAFVDEEVYFDIDNYHDSDGFIMRFNWSFGDGNSSYESYPSHRYSQPGQYNVSLTIKDNGGKYATDSTTVNIIRKNEGLFTPVIYGNGYGYCNEICNFSIAAYDPDDDPVKYTIHWDDGTNESSTYLSNGVRFKVSHQWEKEGEYILSIEATDGTFQTYHEESFNIISKVSKDQFPTSIFILFSLIIVVIIFLIIIKKRPTESN